MKINIFLLLSICVVICLFQSTLFAATKKPPFSSVTIYGKTDLKFNRVSLFKSGGSTEPYKTVNVDSNGSYSIKINIPKDMVINEEYYMTDMRFWKDGNNNKIKDNDEARSQCHFITWYPAYSKVFMQVYQGNTYEIKSSKHNYNWQ